MALKGIWGRPFLDLSDYVDVAGVQALHEEICFGLIRVPSRYTGGSHRWLDIVPDGTPDPELPDYGEVIEQMSDAHFRMFLALGDTPLDPAKARELDFGEEGDVPLTTAQQQWLELRFGVYFPWKIFVDLMTGAGKWEDKADPTGKRFTRDAQLHFPRTLQLVRSLPFESIGAVKLLGLDANDHGTVHRDGDPDEQIEPDHFITLCPGGDKRLFLWDEASGDRVHATGTAYWFNDRDWHGVEADPVFRYSLRVDGRFHPDFLATLEADFA